jgi:predicted secreted Zn-dependent protease
LDASFVTAYLTLLAVGIVLAAGLTSHALAITAELVGLTVTATQALSSRASVGSRGARIGSTVGIGAFSGTTYDEERKSRNSDQARKRTSAHHKLSNGLQKSRRTAH